MVTVFEDRDHNNRHIWGSSRAATNESQAKRAVTVKQSCECRFCSANSRYRTQAHHRRSSHPQYRHSRPSLSSNAAWYENERGGPFCRTSQFEDWMSVNWQTEWTRYCIDGHQIYQVSDLYNLSMYSSCKSLRKLAKFRFTAYEAVCLFEVHDESLYCAVIWKLLCFCWQLSRQLSESCIFTYKIFPVMDTQKPHLLQSSLIAYKILIPTSFPAKNNYI